MDLREAQRLAALKAYKVLDTPADAAIDRLADLARNLFDTPISLVSLVDEKRQWFKARVGLDATSTPRSDAFCTHTIAMGPETVMVVEDAALDPRFAANPLVTGAPDIRFYAGATLTTKDGHNLGTLCVIDDKPRARPSEGDLQRLKLLARIVVDEFELAKAHRETAEKQRLLELAESVAQVGHWRIDIATNHLTWSDQTFRICGLSRDSFTPSVESALGYYSPAHRAELEQGIERAIAQKGGFDLRVQLIRASGEVRDVMARGLCELDDKGEVSALFGLLQDVTDYSNALRSVEQTSDRYRMLTENANDLVTRTGPDGRFTYVSPAVRAISGYAPTEVVGRGALEFIHPDDRDRVAGDGCRTLRSQAHADVQTDQGERDGRGQAQTQGRGPAPRNHLHAAEPGQRAQQADRDSDQHQGGDQAASQVTASGQRRDLLQLDQLGLALGGDGGAEAEHGRRDGGEDHVVGQHDMGDLLVPLAEAKTHHPVE